MVRGTLDTVSVKSNSVSSVSLGGVKTGVSVDLSSTATVQVDQAPGSAITGTAAGLNTVEFSAGSCQVSSPFSALGAGVVAVCSQTAFLVVPPPTPTWTCGIQVEGNFTCTPGKKERDDGFFFLGPNVCYL